MFVLERTEVPYTMEKPRAVIKIEEVMQVAQFSFCFNQKGRKRTLPITKICSTILKCYRGLSKNGTNLNIILHQKQAL